MAVDKLVDSTQLDADLTSVANAIRTKGGTSASLAFPSGFVSAVEAIPSGGGGGDLSAFIMGTLTEIDDDSVTSVRRYAFQMYSGMTSVKLHNASTFGQQAFYGFGSATVLALPAATEWPSITSSSIQTLDMGPNVGRLLGSVLNAKNLDTLIIRKTSLVSLYNTMQFDGTKFANGSTGGTIYIPKVLYDHLGDGTSLDYKAATNWSTIDGYGTITWAKIEGSQYENYYADGTAIPTS